MKHAKAKWRRKLTKKKPSRRSLVIPYDLGRLLSAEPFQYKDPAQYEEVQAVAKSLLRLLMVVD